MSLNTHITPNIENIAFFNSPGSFFMMLTRTLMFRWGFLISDFSSLILFDSITKRYMYPYAVTPVSQFLLQTEYHCKIFVAHR